MGVSERGGLGVQAEGFGVFRERGEAFGGFRERGLGCSGNGVRSLGISERGVWGVRARCLGGFQKEGLVVFKGEG